MEDAHIDKKSCSFAFLPKYGYINVLAVGHPSNVCSLSSQANFEPVSIPLQNGIRFFRHLNPAFPTVCLAVYLLATGERKYWVTTFRIIDRNE